jgi:hypothetical protein
VNIVEFQQGVPPWHKKGDIKVRLVEDASALVSQYLDIALQLDAYSEETTQTLSPALSASHNASCAEQSAAAEYFSTSQDTCITAAAGKQACWLEHLAAADRKANRQIMYVALHC